MVSRDSFLYGTKIHDSEKIVYDSFTSIMGKAEYNIVSVIPKHLEKYVNNMPMFTIWVYRKYKQLIYSINIKKLILIV